MTGPRAIVTVWLVAVAAVLWLFLPRWWSGLSLLPFFALFVVWAGFWGKRGRHAAEFLAELDQVAEPDEPDELDGPGPFIDDVDPVSHYATQAWEAIGQDAPVWWQEAHAGWTDERPAVVLEDDGAWASGPALDQPWAPYQANGMNNPETAPGPAGVLQTMPGPVLPTGGPAAADSDTGEAGPPAELDHTGETDGQAAELPPDPWPDPYDLAASTALAHVRDTFDLLRRMWL
jgi:hypothetical protein